MKAAFGPIRGETFMAFRIRPEGGSNHLAITLYESRSFALRTAVNVAVPEREPDRP